MIKSVQAPLKRQGTQVAKLDLVDRVWHRYHLGEGAKPLISALTIGGTAIALAAELGAAEVLLGVGAGYVAYRMVRFGEPLAKALAAGFKLERGGASR